MVNFNFTISDCEINQDIEKTCRFLFIFCNFKLHVPRDRKAIPKIEEEDFEILMIRKLSSSIIFNCDSQFIFL
jgi:hypothetical protein